MLTTMARSPPRSRMPSIGIYVRRVSVAKWLCSRTLPRRQMSNRPATTSISHEARLGGTASCLFPRSRSASAVLTRALPELRLVAASRLSPPPPVHTRRSARPPISPTPARSTTCARGLIRPASSQRPTRGAFERPGQSVWAFHFTDPSSARPARGFVFLACFPGACGSPGRGGGGSGCSGPECGRLVGDARTGVLGSDLGSGGLRDAWRRIGGV